MLLKINRNSYLRLYWCHSILRQQFYVYNLILPHENMAKWVTFDQPHTVQIQMTCMTVSRCQCNHLFWSKSFSTHSLACYFLGVWWSPSSVQEFHAAAMSITICYGVWIIEWPERGRDEHKQNNSTHQKYPHAAIWYWGLCCLVSL